MRTKCKLIGLSILLLGSLSIASRVCRVSKASPGDVTMDQVARIEVGNSTAAWVRQLLGNPLRMTNYGDCNIADYQDVWEYLGHDRNGAVRISIQFDEVGIARIVTKTPRNGQAVVLAAAPPPKLCKSPRL
jgi:outer membrane protein assembly factor BamE (lipoprotein component of BamABCDE complex)